MVPIETKSSLFSKDALCSLQRFPLLPRVAFCTRGSLRYFWRSGKETSQTFFFSVRKVTKNSTIAIVSSRKNFPSNEGWSTEFHEFNSISYLEMKLTMAENSRIYALTFFLLTYITFTSSSFVNYFSHMSFSILFS